MVMAEFAQKARTRCELLKRTRDQRYQLSFTAFS